VKESAALESKNVIFVVEKLHACAKLRPYVHSKLHVYIVQIMPKMAESL